MISRQRTLLPLAALAALAAACSSTPKKPIYADPAPTAEAPKPEPPKKKPCKALDEKCEAKASTKAKIAKSELTFKPAKGWFYAQGEAVTVAQAADDGPAVAIAQAEYEPKKEAEAREAAIAELAKEINVTLPKKKVNWKKPDDTKEIGAIKLGLWQVDGGARGDKKGPVLFFSAPVEDGKMLLGVSFVPSDDSTSADAAILESIESIAAAEK
ncbi:MAG: hypothetical protein IT372_42070 [Polyangiaceae bacterium]|nr:hypothetical protein [Polyangiaceae bacterium]